MTLTRYVLRSGRRVRGMRNTAERGITKIHTTATSTSTTLGSPAEGESFDSIPETAAKSPAPSPPPNTLSSFPTSSTSKPRLTALRHHLRTLPPVSPILTDTFSRPHTYLRISLTERCNLRCAYCMPSSGIPLSPTPSLLSTPEILELATLFVSQGVNKIRLTGGEPTVRPDIVELVEQLGTLRSRGLKEIGITTNAVMLGSRRGQEWLRRMVDAGLTAVNVSLDTLVEAKFEFVTRRRGWGNVMKAIERCLGMGFGLGENGGKTLKVNVVVMKGVNEDEILDFVEFVKERPVEVRFIEYMPFDGNKWTTAKMYPFTSMLSLIQSRHPAFAPLPTQRPNDTAKTYHIPGYAGRIGFITSMTENFCASCNRLRVTSDGNIKVCLFGNEEVSLRDVMRRYRGREVEWGGVGGVRAGEGVEAVEGGEGIQGGREEMEKELLRVIGAAVKKKEEGHKPAEVLQGEKNRPMILIGG